MIQWGGNTTDGGGEGGGERSVILNDNISSLIFSFFEENYFVPRFGYEEKNKIINNKTFLASYEFI